MANKNVYACGTLYHLFISTLKNIKKNQANDESLLIANNHTPTLVDLAKKLVEERFLTNYCYIPFPTIAAKIHSEKGCLKDIFDQQITAISRILTLIALNFYPVIIFKRGITIFAEMLKSFNNVIGRIFLGLEYDKLFLVKKSSSKLTFEF